jgi:hypothetical protein
MKTVALTGTEGALLSGVNKNCILLPNSHESTRYPFEIVYFTKSYAFVEFQLPAQIECRTLYLPYSALRPNVTIALHIDGCLPIRWLCLVYTKQNMRIFRSI